MPPNPCENARVPVPSVLLPSKNVTVPVAMQHGETVAVRITAWPAVNGLGLEIRVIVVAPLTICVQAADDPSLLLSPLYAALIEWLP